MKICIITYAHSPSNVGGADLYAEKISKQLSKRGHDVFSISARPTFEKSLSYSLEENGNYRVYWFYPLNISTFHNVAKRSAFIQGIWRILDLWNIHSYYVVKKILKLEKPDIVHLHTPVGLSPSVFKAVKSLGIPLVFTLHDYYLICPRIGLLHASGEICTSPHPLCKKYLKFNKKLVSDAPDVVIAPSKFAMDMHTDNGLFNSANKIVLPNAVDFELASSVAKKDHACTQYLYVGQIRPHKGIHTLIKAFSKLEHENIRLNIVGSGLSEAELKQLAHEDNRIIFHGRISDNDLKKMYEISDFTVVPSIWYENSPLVIYESLSNGTPVIGSRIGGIPELVIDGYNGYLFEPGNISELNEILEKSLSDKSMHNELCVNAFNSFKQYNMSEHIEKLEGIYKECINEN